MEEKELNILLDEVKKIAVAAGEAILKVSSDDADVSIKTDGSPLTRADMASQKVIQSRIEGLEPVFPVVSEEGNPEKASQGELARYWLIDPLDGTKEFIKGIGEYTVNIALVEGGVPVLGVIYIPVAGTLYYAGEGLGAWKVEKDKEPCIIHCSEAGQPKTAVVSRSHLSVETEEFLLRLGVSNTIKHGSSLKMCAVAEGSADIYPRFGPTCLWDTAAGTAIARQAGCAVVDLEGKELRYETARGLKHFGFMVYPVKLSSIVSKHSTPEVKDV